MTPDKTATSALEKLRDGRKTIVVACHLGQVEMKASLCDENSIYVCLPSEINSSHSVQKSQNPLWMDGEECAAEVLRGCSVSGDDQGSFSWE